MNGRHSSSLDGLLEGVDWDTITGRPAFALDVAAVRRRVEGRAVMVTGAAGSLGRLLAEALAHAGPARLILYDHHESSLFRMRQGLAAAFPSLSVRSVLGDARAAPLVGRVLHEERPDLLYHLAAYKHVPWGEEDPAAFAEANVLGAQIIVEAATAARVEQIVYPSTDKAVAPPSVYGATKRLAEGILQAAATTGGPRCTIVRFVNVLGSQGSAPEIFAGHIAAGRPITITHREMRRYWITPGHARLLLAHAACFGHRVMTIAPDAGEELATIEIARRIFRALRPEAGEPEMVITGLRPGERLSEPLCAPHEHVEQASLAGVLVVRNTVPVDPIVVAAVVDRLAELLRAAASAAAIRRALFDGARALQSSA